ncbi:M20 family peptidase [Pseudophaeobacter flagellatus]|uniref:M20 family peptidase n=1 Tax=Pseudophaeobacter flagellatus TaxID=2899119 RepID=UPI001E555CDC|nr:M20 family peptidase [Pseudophaeobacter flagellatus]MCD9149364.1 M20 family peptidase [Pseudophaeobacter flagellatus]
MLRILLRILAGLFVLILVLGAVLAINTMRYTPPEVTATTESFALGADTGAATEILSQAVQFETVSDDLARPDFAAFLQFLEQSYPVVHATMSREVLAAQTPLYKWQGSDASLQPVLLAAHYDVVPIPPGSLQHWDHAPFAGTVADGFVWGRGTLDNKGALVAMLSAAEHMIQQGFTPKRTVYFSFGGDEEIGGDGAKAVAEHLTAQGVQLAWALDEGSFVLDKIIPGLTQPVASINLSEKGYVTLDLVATSPGGHSSMPPRVTAVGRIARAVDRLQANPVPGGLNGISEEFFDALGRYFPIDKRVVFANRWLFNPVLEGILSGAPSTDAMLRTTTAPTMLSGSSKENVLAAEATATVNFRIHPRDSVDSIVEHVRATIDDPEIEIRLDPSFASAASPVSASDGPGYLDIEYAILAAFGPLATVPGLTIAATDARHYAQAADAAYRINPFKIDSSDLERFHGINERLSIENLETGINFFGALLQKQ